MSGKERAEVERHVRAIAAALEGAFAREAGGMAPEPAVAQLAVLTRPVVLGPAPCVIERAKDRYRFHLLVKCPTAYPISDAIAAALAEVGERRGLSVVVDIDPYDLM